jgi:hypothetical protein
MRRIICWIKGHVWKDMGTAMSAPDNKMGECSRCGKHVSVDRLYGDFNQG